MGRALNSFTEGLFTGKDSEDRFLPPRSKPEISSTVFHFIRNSSFLTQ